MSEQGEQGKLIAENRYFSEGEDWKALCNRVAEALSVNEKDSSVWKQRFYAIIYNMEFLPGGRILRNAGKVKRNLCNCFSLPVDDSIVSIGDVIRNSLITWASGGGVGINFSGLRPLGAEIKTSGGCSSGLVSFLGALDGVANTIESGGQRRAAAIAIVSVEHPEVLEFIDSKLKHGKLSNFNISVAITSEFLEAVERNSDWNLSFRQKVYKTVKARELWSRILENMIKSAEPGLLNWDNVVKNNSYYFDSISGVNPCGELPLGAYGSCDLGALVLPSFVSDKQTNWVKMESTIKAAVRLLDNVIDVTAYPLPQMKDVAEAGRRIGLGVMGLADYLFKKEVRYGSEKSLLEVETLFRFVRNKAYETSVELAKEKGPFPKFSSVDYGKASFIRKLPAKLRSEIKDNGIRNVTMLTCAPAGTTSLVASVTSGIEPLFSKAYLRKDRISSRVYIHSFYEKCLKEDIKIPDWFVDAADLKPEEHFEMQATIQRYIDGSISKTTNLPEGTDVKRLSKLLLEYIYELKGVTVYVDKSRKEQVLYPLSKDEVKEYLRDKTVGGKAISLRIKKEVV